MRFTELNWMAPILITDHGGAMTRMHGRNVLALLFQACSY